MRRIAVVLACLVLMLSFSHAAIADEAPPPSDLIVVMVDDLGAIDQRILERLPNIKALWLDGGLRFDAAYSETPLCCPGRAAFLTGQHTRKHGVVENNAALLDPSLTLATTLHDAGYWTMYVGKYLNKARYLPDKTPPGWDHVAMLDWDPLAKLKSQWWIDDVETTVGYDDRFTLEQSVAWLREAPLGQPVFLYANPRAPHTFRPASVEPWLPEVEPVYATDARCSDIPPWKPPSYAYTKQPDGFPLVEICRSLLTVDEMVGALAAETALQGRLPVWLFMSDNGMAWGAGGFPQKNVPQAGRLPMYFAGLGVVPGATTALVSNIDIGPTIAELAGTTMPLADGVSFVPVLRGAPTARSWMLEDHPRGGTTHGPWRGRWWGVRTPLWHLVKIKDWAVRLTDLTADPWEMTDVRAQNRSRVKKMKALAAPLLY